MYRKKTSLANATFTRNIIMAAIFSTKRATRRCFPNKWKITTSWYICLLLFQHPIFIESFRIQGSQDEYDPFSPYETGNVGNTNDPEIPQRERTNPGYIETLRQMITVGKNRLQSCPGMVGPIPTTTTETSGEEHYYCLGKEYGYCDRRTGTCFCNTGYTGLSCNECAPTHIRVGELCYPSKRCPNDCSYNGFCDRLTGRCECSIYRSGLDCSELKCSLYHEFCIGCKEYHEEEQEKQIGEVEEGDFNNNIDGICVQCAQGYTVNASAPPGQQCISCHQTFDPRCMECNTTSCLSCVDLLLTSVRRSGKRKVDPELPPNELERELSVTVPFGSQQLNAFDEAEYYFVVEEVDDDENKILPLNESAHVCHQGLNRDASQTCYPTYVSNIVCGNHGTITFSSPTYEVYEDEEHLRLTIRRSGGGVGLVSVSYEIQHITTNQDDVSPTAFYTSNQTVVFHHGQVQASFLITIHDDRIVEENETFVINLYEPTGYSTLGNQMRAIVTIIDDDATRTCSGRSLVVTSSLSNKGKFGTHQRSIAGQSSLFNILATSCLGERQAVGGDLFAVLALTRDYGEEHEIYDFARPTLDGRVLGTIVDCGGGEYTSTVNVTASGTYDLHAYHIIPGGLRGWYYSDPFFSEDNLVSSRIDAIVNFTWGAGQVAVGAGTDYASIRWEGFVMPTFSERFTFWVDVGDDDDIRLYVDGFLLIDCWGSTPYKSRGLASAEHDMVSLNAIEITLEYREFVGTAAARLLWSSASNPLEVIPSHCLFNKEHLIGSPYHYTVISAEVHAKNSIAFGIGLSNGIAGKEHHFSIRPKDAFGNFRGDFDRLNKDSMPAFKDKDLATVRGKDGFYAVATLLSIEGDRHGATEVPVMIRYNTKTRMYEASYIPTKSGTYHLAVTLAPELLGSNTAGQNHIYESPFTVITEPDITCASESEVYGGYGNCASLISDNKTCTGVSFGLAGTEHFFRINSFDLNHNKRAIGGDSWEVIALNKKNNKYQKGRVEDHKNGEYIVYITPYTSGPNELLVTLNGVHARGSPFLLNVRHGQAHGPSCFMMTDLKTSKVIATVSNYFTVQTMDKCGNFLETNLIPYMTDVIIENKDPDGYIDEINHSSHFIGNGSFRITYIPMKTGLNTLSIRVNGEHIKGSPFEINAFPGNFSGSESTVTGHGLSKATAGVEASFTIQARDIAGNSKTTDGAHFNAMLTMQSLSYRPDDYDTLVDDKWGADSKVTGTYDYIGHGQYIVRYNATISGTYQLDILGSTNNSTQALHITGSPFFVYVSPAQTSAHHSIVTGEGTRLGIAGELAPVHIYSRDRFGNFVYNTTEHFTSRLNLLKRHEQMWESNRTNTSTRLRNNNEAYLRSHIIQPTIIASGSGNYVADYTPSLAGDYELRVMMDQYGGLVGTYFSSDDFDVNSLEFTLYDDEVNKNWNNGKFSPHECKGSAECSEHDRLVSTDRFSVDWEGKLMPDHDERYEFFLQCNEGGSAEMIVDGKYLFEWASCGMRRGSMFMSASKRTNIRIRYSHDHGEPFIVLKYSSPTIGGPILIPKSNLYREFLASGKVYFPSISPGRKVSPSKSTAIGASLTKAFAGSMQHFLVECRDGFGNGIWGNLMLEGGANVFAHARLGRQLSLENHIHATVLDNKNGTYTVEYFPIMSGTYHFSVTVVDVPAHEDFGYHYRDSSVASAHVIGSPFLLQVEPGNTSPEMSHIHITGQGPIKAEVDVETWLLMYAKDEQGNMRSKGGDVIAASLISTHGKRDKHMIECNIVDEANGSYTIKFTPKGHSGLYSLHITIQNKNEEQVDIMDSPYSVNIGPGATEAMKTHISSGETSRSTRFDIHENTAWTFSSKSGYRRDFEIITKDIYGNAVARADKFVTKIRGDTNILEEESKLTFVDISEALYKLSYQVSQPGQYLMDIGLAGGNGLLGEYYT
mmetsp:Transcript_23801/g.35130  ORF Transcript_23801/g.35130 Transcript_23801/m.35130 type:complete len:1928 (-) Transcript_23801:1096-6879(-)